MGFFIDTVVLPALFGMIGISIVLLGRRLARVAHVRVQFRQANESLVAKVQELVRVKNEVVLLELEVVELVEKITPQDRARWVVQCRELAHALPPMVLEQARRFGLTAPPPEIIAEHNVTDTEPATVTSIDAWTGKTRTG